MDCPAELLLENVDRSGDRVCTDDLTLRLPNSPGLFAWLRFGLAAGLWLLERGGDEGGWDADCLSFPSPLPLSIHPSLGGVVDADLDVCADCALSPILFATWARRVIISRTLDASAASVAEDMFVVVVSRGGDDDERLSLLRLTPVCEEDEEEEDEEDDLEEGMGGRGGGTLGISIEADSADDDDAGAVLSLLLRLRSLPLSSCSLCKDFAE